MSLSSRRPRSAVGLAVAGILFAGVHAIAGMSNTTQLEIDHAGVLKVGMTLAEAKAVGKITIHNNEDPMGECVFADIAGAPKGFSFMLIKGVIARFDVFDPPMKTAEGAGVGSSEDEIKRLYVGAHIKVTPHAYVDGHYFEISRDDKPNFLMIFETDGKKVTAFRAGRLPEVGWIEGCA